MKVRKLMMSAALMAVLPLAAQKESQVRLFPDEAKQSIPKEIYGQFAEHLGTCIYGGLWVGENSAIPNTDGYRNHVLQALKDLKTTCVLPRFAQWRFARPRYFCKVLMKNRENMEARFDFADFYESHYRSALRYASMYVFNDEDARDIVSDVLLRSLEQGKS